MLASGKLSLDILPENMEMEDSILGLEFSGRDINGRRVMGIVKAGALATTVLADPNFLWEVPDTWTLEQAATVPLAYVISFYALVVRGRLKTYESVLISIGTDGMGQAAIALALHIGCKVFVTVNTQDNKEYIQKIFPQVPDKYICISGDINFEQQILLETHRRGVDVVLTLLSDEELQINARYIAGNARFLMIGNYKLPNDYSLKNMTFHSIRFEALLEECADKKEIIRLISEGIENGAVQPLSSIVFTEQQIEDGFKFLLTDEYIGKTLLKIRDEESNKCMSPPPKSVSAVPRTYMNPRKSYIIVGGLGGFGLELTNWIIARGAKFIILVTSSGICTGYQMLCLRRWSENGINVVVSMEDITILSGAEKLIKTSNQLAPVGGIFNLAAVLRDGLIQNLHAADFNAVSLPKVNGTKNLDAVSKISCPLLDYFVVFSSASCGRGNIAQCNYGLANSAMERIMEQRKAAGLPGLAIQWGAIGDTGIYIGKKIHCTL